MSQTSGLSLIGLQLRFSGWPCPRCARQAVGVSVCARARTRCVGARRRQKGTRNKRGKAAELSMRVPPCPVCVRACESVCHCSTGPVARAESGGLHSFSVPQIWVRPRASVPDGGKIRCKSGSRALPKHSRFCRTPTFKLVHILSRVCELLRSTAPCLIVQTSTGHPGTNAGEPD